MKLNFWKKIILNDLKFFFATLQIKFQIKDCKKYDHTKL